MRERGEGEGGRVGEDRMMGRWKGFNRRKSNGGRERDGQMEGERERCREMRVRERGRDREISWLFLCVSVQKL